MKKRVLSILLALVLLATCIPFTALSVSAATGYYIFDAISISAGKTYTKSWTSYTDSNDCYNEITVPSRGYVTFSISKPIDDYGEVSSFELELYDSDAQLVWSTDTSHQKNTFSPNYTYKIGLARGTYYMNIEPNFYVTSGSISSTYKYTCTKTKTWEIENNNNSTTATALTLNKKYSAVYGEGDYGDDDYYKVKLTKGKSYQVVVGNAAQLDEGTTILKMYDPSGDRNYDVYLGSGRASGTSEIYDIKAEMSGWHYIQFENECDEAGISYTIQVKTKPVSISKLKISLSTTSYTYNGKAKKPSVVVKTASGTKLSDSNYTVTYASGRKNVGKYKVTVKMNGVYYTGTKTLYFTVKPAKTSVTGLTPTKTQLKVQVKRQTQQTTGYEIQYSTSKSFKSYKVERITRSKGSVWLTGLKSKTTYYVRVRTYKVVNGTKYYSGWSTIKYKKTK